MSSLAEATKKKLKLKSTLIFVGIIWGVYLLGGLLSLPGIGVDLCSFGLQPRSLTGLFGIVTMPFLHIRIGHLVSNTIPLLVLLVLLAGSRDRSWEVVTGIVVLSGACLWIVGRGNVHVGASGLVAGLVVFLVLNGVFERRVVPVLVAIVTFFFYGGTVFVGFIPNDRGVSWEGHLCGAVAGGLLAFVLSRKWRRPSHPKGDVEIKVKDAT